VCAILSLTSTSLSHFLMSFCNDCRMTVDSEFVISHFCIQVRRTFVLFTHSRNVLANFFVPKLDRPRFSNISPLQLANVCTDL